MLTLEQAINDLMDASMAIAEVAESESDEANRINAQNSADDCKQLAAWLRELQERRKEPEIIFCHECKHWKDSDGVYRRGISAESKCPVNSRQVYEGTFFCGMAKRRTDG